MAQITLRLTIKDPVPGVRYSLQDKANLPVGAITANDAPLSFDVPITLNDDGRLTGTYVRREGPVRRFVYVAIGKQAESRQLGNPDAAWDRRAKIDIHDIPADLLALAREGRTLEALLPGLARDGGPACATVRLLEPWRPVEV